MGGEGCKGVRGEKELTKTGKEVNAAVEEEATLVCGGFAPALEVVVSGCAREQKRLLRGGELHCDRVLS